MWPGGVSASKLRTSTCEWPPQRNPLKLLEVIPMSWLSVCWQTKFSKRRTKQHKQCAGGACSLRASPTPHCRSHNAANLNTACSHVHDTSGSSNTECFSGPAICACASRVLVGLCIGMRICIRSRIRLCHRKVLISSPVVAFRRPRASTTRGHRALNSASFLKKPRSNDALQAQRGA